MGMWSSVMRRSKTEELRKEDMSNLFFDIHNDNSKGSVNTFTTEQLKELDEITSKADALLKAIPTESDIFEIFRCCPIYLIPYETCIVEGRNRCNSDFAKKMRELYNKEIEECSQEDIEMIKAKYSPWICNNPTSCSSCKIALSTPLGYYQNSEIFICLDKIKEVYPSEVIAIAAKVIFHEIGHHVMYNTGYPSYETSFDYWVEESLANKFALKYMKAASVMMNNHDLYEAAERMVRNQKEPYKLGVYLFEHNALDCLIFQQNKTNINQTIGERWVESVCLPSKRNIVDVNRLFYRSFENKITMPSSSPFDAWVLKAVKSSSWAKRYAAVINSPHMGVVFKEIMGWRYNTLAECTSIHEVEELRDKLLEKGSVTKLFNKASGDVAAAAVGKYIDYIKP